MKKTLTTLLTLALLCAALSGCMVSHLPTETQTDAPVTTEVSTEIPDTQEDITDPVTDEPMPPETTPEPKTPETPPETTTEDTAAETETETETESETETETQTETETETTTEDDGLLYSAMEEVTLDPKWEFADFSAIHTGTSILYRAKHSNGIVVGVNAGHGCKGGTREKTYCHPDKTPKVTGGTTGAGAVQAMSVSIGMTFLDGALERDVAFRTACFLRDKLLAAGYDVLMIRDGLDVQLDNVARTVICNNVADCHIALHWDGDGLNYDKGAFFMSVPDGIKYLPNVAKHWEKSEELGRNLIEGLRGHGTPIWKNGALKMDLTQTSFSSIPSVDIELGNACSSHSDETLERQAEGLLQGIKSFFHK